MATKVAEGESDPRDGLNGSEFVNSLVPFFDNERLGALRDADLLKLLVPLDSDIVGTVPVDSKDSEEVCEKVRFASHAQPNPDSLANTLQPSIHFL